MFDEKLKVVLRRVKEAQEYEEQKQFGMALDTYTLAITELLSNYSTCKDSSIYGLVGRMLIVVVRC